MVGKLKCSGSKGGQPEAREGRSSHSQVWRNRFSPLKDELDGEQIEKVCEGRTAYEVQLVKNNLQEDVSVDKVCNEASANQSEVDVILWQQGQQCAGVEEEDEKTEEPLIAINLNNLVPGKLIIIPIVIAGSTFRALIDSGSTANIIKEDILVKSKGELSKGNQFTIKG